MQFVAGYPRLEERETFKWDEFPIHGQLLKLNEFDDLPPEYIGVCIVHPPVCVGNMFELQCIVELNNNCYFPAIVIEDDFTFGPPDYIVLESLHTGIYLQTADINIFDLTKNSALSIIKQWTKLEEAFELQQKIDSPELSYATAHDFAWAHVLQDMLVKLKK